AGAARQADVAAAQPGADDRVLSDRPAARAARRSRVGRAARRVRDPAARAGAEGLQPAEAGDGARGLPHLAALVRRDRVLPQPARRRALRAGARHESDTRTLTPTRPRIVTHPDAP